MLFRSRKLNQTLVSVTTPQAKGKFDRGLKKFLDEARTLAKFNNSKNIIGIRDFFSENNTAYIVMDFLEGCDLSHYTIKLNRPLSYNEVIKLLGPVFDALENVHKAGLLHRDISPDNIYITHDQRPILIDFGAARQYVNQAEGLSIIFKPGYAPEEQYRSKGIQGPYTDVYALGATIYHMMVGRGAPDSLDRIEKDQLISPSHFGVVLPPSAETALLKALCVKAKDRYQSIIAFKRAFIRKSNGINRNVAADSKTVVPYNDAKGRKGIFNKFKSDVAFAHAKKIANKMHVTWIDILNKVDALASDGRKETIWLVRILVGIGIVMLLIILVFLTAFIA